MKHCSKCGQLKPLDQYRVNKAAKDGRQSACKQCQKQHYINNKQAYRDKSEQWRIDNPSKYKAATKAYYDANAEIIRQRAKEWHHQNKTYASKKAKERYAANPEYWRQKSRDWIAANREYKRARDSQYAKEHPEVYKASAARRKARIRQNGIYAISQKEMRKLYASPCLYCGSTQRIEADHVIPIARGGTHSIGNLVPACKSCNASKRQRTITEWKKESPRIFPRASHNS